LRIPAGTLYHYSGICIAFPPHTDFYTFVMETNQKKHTLVMYITASRARRTGAEPEEPLRIQDYHGPEKLVLQPFFVKVSPAFP
jgi:hypothetical protein